VLRLEMFRLQVFTLKIKERFIGLSFLFVGVLMGASFLIILYVILGIAS